jgi:hypothetical protein
MKIDLTKDGLESVFTPWQRGLLTLLTNDRLKTWTSAQLHMGLSEVFLQDNVSRASVINFMKLLEAWGLVAVTMGHKQGGNYKIYQFPLTLGDLREHLASLAENWAKNMRGETTT